MRANIIPLSEGVFTIGGDKVFVPFDDSKHVLEHRPIGALLVEIQPFLVQINDKNILLDSGLGFKNENGQLQLHANLEQNGVRPHDIDMVLLSHLHKDHAGGILFTNSLGVTELSFPNATYYVSKQEFNFGLEKGLPSYTVDDFTFLKNSPQVEWLDEQGRIHNYISYWQDGGHCPHHTSFLIHNEVEPIFFGGDVAPQLKQLKTKYIAKYDAEGRKAMELRQAYSERGKNENWTFLFYHDVKIPIGKI